MSGFEVNVRLDPKICGNLEMAMLDFLFPILHLLESVHVENCCITIYCNLGRCLQSASLVIATAEQCQSCAIVVPLLLC